MTGRCDEGDCVSKHPGPVPPGHPFGTTSDPNFASEYPRYYLYHLGHDRIESGNERSRRIGGLLVRAGPGENRDPRGTCEIVAGAAFEEALVRTYLALIEPAMKEVKTRWIVSAS